MSRIIFLTVLKYFKPLLSGFCTSWYFWNILTPDSQVAHTFSLVCTLLTWHMANFLFFNICRSWLLDTHLLFYHCILYFLCSICQYLLECKCRFSEYRNFCYSTYFSAQINVWLMLNVKRWSYLTAQLIFILILWLVVKLQHLLCLNKTVKGIFYVLFLRIILMPLKIYSISSSIFRFTSGHKCIYQVLKLQVCCYWSFLLKIAKTT